MAADLENSTDICVTEARWRVESDDPGSTRVVAVDGAGGVICLVCEAYGNEVAALIADEHNKGRME